MSATWPLRSHRPRRRLERRQLVAKGVGERVVASRSGQRSAMAARSSLSDRGLLLDHGPAEREDGPDVDPLEAHAPGLVPEQLVVESQGCMTGRSARAS